MKNHLYYDVYWATQHVIFIFLSSFVAYATHILSLRYCDILHRSALHLGNWDKLETRNMLLVNNWNEKTLWPYGALVKHGRDLYRAQARPYAVLGEYINNYQNQQKAPVEKKKPRKYHLLSRDWSQILHKEESKVSLPGINDISTTFCTGTSYTGKWNKLGMTEEGIYVYQHGCVYTGSFYNGRFHGKGTLTYPMGQKMEGVWEHGCMVSFKFTNIDGLTDGGEDWRYCQYPDRRFAIEQEIGLQPSNKEILTNSRRHLPPNLYDTGDGFFDPRSEMLMAARKTDTEQGVEEESIADSVAEIEAEFKKFREMNLKMINVDDEEENYNWTKTFVSVSNTRKEWIKRHCRKGWDEAAGYRPMYYPEWITGRRDELKAAKEKHEKFRGSQPRASDISDIFKALYQQIVDVRNVE